MPTPEPTTAQPKISQRMILRTAVLLFVLALMILGYRYFEGQHGDFNLGDSDSAGLLAALETKDDGKEAVVIHPDGKVDGTASWKTGNVDQDIVWRPDGRFLFFVSDRDGGTFHLYRWNPAQPDAEPMTGGTRGRSAPSYPADDPADANDSMLMVCGGTVQRFEEKKKITPQVLPPASSEITQSSDVEAGGSDAEFQAYYGNIGTAFRYARFDKNERYIVAVMEREGGEVLIIQDIEPDKNGNPVHPMPVVAGDHIDFDIDPKSGNVVFTVQNFKFIDPDHPPEQFIKNGKVVRPFNHAVGMIDPSNPHFTLVTVSLNDQMTFGAPAVSPDGAAVLFTVGTYDGTTQSMQPKMLFSCPVKEGGSRSGSQIVSGDVYEPSWSPDGSKIAFVMRTNGKRDIYTMSSDGSSQEDLTKGSGDFSFPRFSPQVKTGG